VNTRDRLRERVGVRGRWRLAGEERLLRLLRNH
jgi:hypothetical protein